MATAVPYRPSQNAVGSGVKYRDPTNSFSSFPGSVGSSNISTSPNLQKTSSRPSHLQTMPLESPSSSSSLSAHLDGVRGRSKRLKSQYPPDAPERHVEYILVASFDIDRGSTMEHQYPGVISPDENMLAELMLPDQTHVRSQDWTIFFLHKDAGAEEEEVAEKEARREQRRERIKAKAEALSRGEVQEEDLSSDEAESDEDDAGEPPLMYVLNLVNTKKDNTVKRGAVVKAMAICTRHSFLHIYKPLLLLALEDYFKSPYPETLAALYNAVNAMDLSLMPRLSYLEKNILQATELKDVLAEKFEIMIQQRLEDEKASNQATQDSPSKAASRYTIPRDTHEFESKVIYNDIPIPIKVPTALSSETVGDFSLVKLIQTFGNPHVTSPQPFTPHSHLTTSGPNTHPIIVLINAMLTQKRIIFLGHNRPSGEVAEAVLAACALGSGSILRGFTRHAFPYTDLTKIDELLKVPGFIAGVTNPAFANHPEWWDLLCDIPTGRMKISSSIEQPEITEGLVAFQQQHPSLLSPAGAFNNTTGNDATGDTAFMDDINRSIVQRHGEPAIRWKFRSYISKFTRVAAAFEEIVYGASNLYSIPPTETDPPEISPTSPSRNRINLVRGSPTSEDHSFLRGHGYVWPDDLSKNRELAANAARIEGWRNTRSYYSFISDVARQHSYNAPSSALSPTSPTAPTLKPRIDLQHHHDRLRNLKLSPASAGAIYLAICAHSVDYDSICHLLTITPLSQAGLFYICYGLWHPDKNVRSEIVGLLERIQEHPVGRHWWARVGGWVKMGFWRARRERDAASRTDDDDEAINAVGVINSNVDSFGGRVGRAS